MVTRPQYIHHHSPFLLLNKQLCEHLGRILPIDKLGVRQSLPKEFKEKVKQMPVVGASMVFKAVEGDNMAKILFDNKVFQTSSEMVSIQNAKIRNKNQFPDHMMMIAQPQHVRDSMRIPDVFRIDPVRQSNERIQDYRDLLAGMSLANDFAPQVVSLSHQRDPEAFSPKQIGLKCCFITEVRNDDGTYMSVTCSNFAARFQAHCPTHSMAVSLQERRMYEGFASTEAETSFSIVEFGTKVQIKIPNLNKNGFRHQPFEVEYQSVHRQYHNIENLVRMFGRHYRLTLRDPSKKFNEQDFKDKFGSPGRHLTWKSAFIQAKSMMEQLYIPKNDTWATLRIFLQKIGNAQGWAGKCDNETMSFPTDKQKAVDQMNPIKPAQVKEKLRDGYCYNDQVSPEERLIFQKEGIKYHPRTKPAEQQRPLYYLEPDNFMSENEAKGVLIMGYATVILQLDHTLINTGS